MTTQDIAARFARDTSEHEMTIVQDNGLHRHLRFRRVVKRPDGTLSKSSLYWFDLITVPGSLIFQGDGESYVFRRLPDMFAFFRGSAYKGQPNLRYWAEKLTDGRDRVMVYDQELLVAHVMETVADYYEESTVPAQLAEKIQWALVADLLGDQSIDLKAVDDFRWWADPNEEFRYPRKDPDFQFVDVFDWPCRDHAWWFAWACHGIVWGIGEYDRHRKAVRDRGHAVRRAVVTAALTTLVFVGLLFLAVSS